MTSAHKKTASSGLPLVAVSLSYYLSFGCNTCALFLLSLLCLTCVLCEGTILFV
uniref:Uncharacterized protein n=1 Tax=uncultured marine virus TaxID=186617 RepID=A0A0F7L9R7_9VIRU|nr:hypothetical protein SVPG_00029 [uncultured marine virus]